MGEARQRRGAVVAGAVLGCLALSLLTCLGLGGLAALGVLAAALDEDDVRRLFPGAAVTRHAPASRPGRSIPLQSHTAAAVFLILAAEALLASYRPPARA